MTNDVQQIWEAYERVPAPKDFIETARAKDRTEFDEWMKGRTGTILKKQTVDIELLYNVWVYAQKYGRYQW